MRLNSKNLHRPRWALLALFAASLFQISCASGHEFWTYVVDPPPEKGLDRELGTVAKPVSSPDVVKVAYSDGANSTQVEVPVLSSGQQIVIDQKNRPASEAVSLAPLAPTDADKGIETAYVAGGKTIAKSGAPVSIVKTRAMIKKLVKQGNYSLALEYADQLLKRYPDHVETLRSKGSILLRMGEREAALETYRRAQEVESDPQTKKQIDELEKSLGRR